MNWQQADVVSSSEQIVAYARGTRLTRPRGGEGAVPSCMPSQMENYGEEKRKLDHA